MGNGCLFKLSTDKSNRRSKGQIYRQISCDQCQGYCYSRIPNQNDWNPFLSLYKIVCKYNRTELTIYDTKKEQEKVNIIDTKLPINEAANITQLSNGDLFVLSYDGAAFIIDRSDRVRVLPCGVDCSYCFAICYDNNIYCFGGYLGRIGGLALCKKFDLKKNLWTNLASLPNPDFSCHSVIFNGNILISGFVINNIWLYSVGIDSFSTIPYDFSINTRKILINADRLYLIQWNEDGLIYESEDVYNWKQISKWYRLPFADQIYCLYSKEKVYISIFNDTKVRYFQFGLKNKDLNEFRVVYTI